MQDRDDASRPRMTPAFATLLLGPVLAFAVFSWMAVPLAAQEALPPADPQAALQRSQDRIRSGDYDGAIEILKTTIAGARADTSVLRPAYLLLAKSLVYLGNDLKRRPQGRSSADLNYAEAKRRIAECLSIRELRHTRAEPVEEYPEEMVRMFDEVRSEIFGSFRIIGLQPPDATVLLGADTLRIPPGETLPGDVNLAVGGYVVKVGRTGYRTLTDPIRISPNATLERSYVLPKKRGRMWYATRAGAGALIAGGTVALVRWINRDDPLDPLPEAPPPPARPR